MLTLVCLVLLALHALLWFGRWQILFWRHTAATPPLSSASLDDAELPPLAVLVPARNEEPFVGAAVRSLVTQDYPRLAVLVANDHSTDRTGAILHGLAEEFPERLRVVDVPCEPPPGWMGKPHAVSHALRLAPPATELFLFTDADVIHEQGTLRRAVAHLQEHRADLVALMPRLDNVGFWEHAVMPMLMQLGAVTLDPRRIHDPARGDVMGVGAFMLVRRGAYDRAGGHEAIRGEVVDDIALAMKVKRSGGTIRLTRDPGGSVHLRMYTGLGSLTRGFVKNMHSAIGGGFGRGAAAAVGFVLAHCIPVAVLAVALAAEEWGVAALAGALWLASGAILVHRARAYMAVKPGVTVWAYPLGALLCAGIMLRSAWLGGVRGVVRWRGRELPRPKQELQLYGKK